jgi:hypothetical protein
MTTVIALIGPKALYLMYAWLIGALIASTAAGLKGYSERAGLATGLLLSLIGAVIWMFFPWRHDSRWSRVVKPTDLATIAGGFLLALVFLPSFHNEADKGKSLFNTDLPLAILVAIAAFVAVGHVLMAASEAGPGWILTRGRTIAAAAGLVATAIVAYRVASPPDTYDSPSTASYLMLIGAVLTQVGPALSRLQPFPRASQESEQAAEAAAAHT